MLSVALLLLLGAYICNAQMLRQCLCSETLPCKDKAVNNVIPCADKCEKHARSAGISYQVLRGCIMQYRSQIERAMQCSINAFGNSCSNTRTNRMIPKRYAAGIEIAIMNEINSMIAVNGLTSQASKYVGAGRKYASCVQKCVEKQSNDCVKKANCGLDLPSDSVIARTIKNCAVNSGVLTTQVVRSLCQCAVRAGAVPVARFCNQITIS
uniref:Uncharacterized protein n=1 Tax=Parascaris univalens TaxID=6257 RepID=A0A914ZU55_PARUN